MARYSSKSKAKLAECTEGIQLVFGEVIRSWDHTVLTGHRDEATQNQKFEQNLSQVEWPDSKHNSIPSRAIDVAPWPIDWNATEEWIMFGGYVLGVAESLGISLRWGGAWNGTRNLPGQFDDLGHFEEIEG